MPDVERDKKDAALKEKIRQEYPAKQEALKSMKMEMSFSYFDILNRIIGNIFLFTLLLLHTSRCSTLHNN